MILECVFVMALHGVGGSGPAMQNTTGSLPESWQVEYPSSPTLWWDINPGSADEKRLVEKAKQSPCSTKVVVGHSNGGFMASMLICRHPEVFDGAYSVNGVTKPESCPLPRTSRQMVISSDLDTIVMQDGSVAPAVRWFIPEWALKPHKFVVRTNARDSDVTVEPTVIESSTSAVWRWGRFTWIRRFTFGHEWGDATPRMINFVRNLHDGR